MEDGGPDRLCRAISYGIHWQFLRVLGIQSPGHTGCFTCVITWAETTSALPLSWQSAQLLNQTAQRIEAW